MGYLKTIGLAVIGFIMMYLVATFIFAYNPVGTEGLLLGTVLGLSVSLIAIRQGWWD